MSRFFILGDEWVYLKIYLGKESFDRILMDIVDPLADALLSSQLICEFFFIRYEDRVGPHLRVRFHISGPASLAPVLSAINQCFKPLIEIRRIKNLEFDTYVREIERYGERNYPLTESVFCVDSACQLKLFKALRNYNDKNLRWRIGLALVDDLMSIFKMEGEQYVAFVEKYRDAYRSEFGCNDKQIRQIHNDHYRNNQAEVENALLRRFPEDIAAILNARKEKIGIIYDKFSRESNDNFESYLGSIIHMTANRFFEDAARVCEMALYEFLFKYKRSEGKRKSVNEECRN